MGFFRQTWVKILIVVILVLGVGSTAAYLLGIRQNQPNAFSQPAPSLQAPTSTRFSPTIVQPSLTSFPTSIGQITTTTSWKTYTNSKYGLSFYYPPNYTISIDNDYGVWLLTKDVTNNIQIIFESPQACQANAKINQAFSDFASQVAMCESLASGVEGQSYFDKVIQQIPLQNPHGLTGYEFYFHWRSEKFNGDNPVTDGDATAGPILAYDVSRQTNNVLREVEIIIGPPNSPSTINHSTLDKIGNSMRFIQQ